MTDKRNKSLAKCLKSLKEELSLDLAVLYLTSQAVYPP